MTQYDITVGYNSSHGPSEVGKVMLGVLDMLREKPELIAAEVLRVEPLIDRQILAECVLAYANSEQSKAVWVAYDESQDKLPVIMQSASGGEPYRSVKQACRRAVCRLIMLHCHERLMEISIVVC